MSKKQKLISRLEAEVERLTAELAGVEKKARKRIKRAESEASALRGEVLKWIGRGDTPKSERKESKAEPAKADSEPTEHKSDKGTPKVAASPIKHTAKKAATKPAKSAPPKAKPKKTAPPKLVPPPSDSVPPPSDSVPPPFDSVPSPKSADDTPPVTVPAQEVSTPPAVEPATTAVPRAAGKRTPSGSPAKKAVANWPTAGPSSEPRRHGPTVVELRAQAKAKGIKGYSSMTKAQLLDALG